MNSPHKISDFVLWTIFFDVLGAIFYSLIIFTGGYVNIWILSISLISVNCLLLNLERERRLRLTFKPCSRQCSNKLCPYKSGNEGKEILEQYYQNTWGWSPIKTSHIFDYRIWGWEEYFPLKTDLALNLEDVQIGARVSYNCNRKRILLQIIFSKHSLIPENNRKAFLNCTHTAIHPRILKGGEYESWLPLVYDDLSKSEKIIEKLLPEEHYSSLRSYIAGIAEMGLENLFLQAREESILPFGFNDAMQQQILVCLKQVAPHASLNIQAIAIENLLARADLKWMLEREFLLDQIYDLTLLGNEAFLNLLPKTTQAKAIQFVRDCNARKPNKR